MRRKSSRPRSGTLVEWSHPRLNNRVLDSEQFAKGCPQHFIPPGEAVDQGPATVRSWRARFTEDGLAHLGEVRPGRGRKPVIPQSTIDEIVDLTRNSKPEGQTHWSVRTMAAKVGVSPAQVQRIWAARGLKPHLVDSFKLAIRTKSVDSLL